MIEPENSPKLRLVQSEHDAPRWVPLLRTQQAHAVPEILPPSFARRDPYMMRARRPDTPSSRPMAHNRLTSACGLPLELELVDPFSVIDDIIELLPVPAGIKIAINVESTPFLAQRAPLETVLSELIGNAVAHHDLGRGLVTVGLEARDGYHAFSVADDGPGVLPSLWNQLAALGDGASARETEAIGGLALCARVANRHRAKIVFDIRPGERGTVTRLLWPQFQRVIDG